MTRKLILPLLAALLLLLTAPTFAQDHSTPAGAHAAEPAAEAHAAKALGEAGVHDTGHGEETSLISGPKQAMITALTTVIVFIILVAVLGKAAWGPIVTGLKAREDKIRKDLQDAEAARAAAETRQKELEARLAAAEAQVRDIIAKGTADAERIATSIKQQATDDASAQRERAVKDIDAAKNAALSEVYEQTAVLATGVAEKILKRNLNPDDQRDLVQQSLSQLQTLNR